MPVTTPHHEYNKQIKIWNKIRTVLEGEDAVKGAGVDHLPMLGGQAESLIDGSVDYSAYKTRASFYDASERTVTGLAGAVMRKPPVIEAPDVVQKQLEMLGVRMEPIRQMMKASLEEVLGLGRYGLFIDASEKGERIFITPYFAENIINWKEEIIGGHKVLVMVVLKECVYVAKDDDPFEMKEITQYRVLRLGHPNVSDEDVYKLGIDHSDLESGNIYYQEIWRKKEVAEGQPKPKDEGWFVDQLLVPRGKGGKTFNYIPFEFFNPEGNDPNPGKSPILGIVNLALSHYRNSADHEHGLHFTALPTAWVAGFDPKTSKLLIGSQVAWVSENPNANAGFLEFTGAGLAAIKQAMEAKEKQMAVLGARLLEVRQPGVEAAETVKMRQEGEQSVLANIAHSVGAGWARVLTWYAQWNGSSDVEVEVKLNTDFDPRGMEPALLQQLVQMLQSNSLSYPAFYYIMEKHEMYPEGWTIEDEKKAIIAGKPGGELDPNATTDDLGVDEEEEYEPPARQREPEEEPVDAA